METTLPAGVFAQALGTSWHTLGEPVRRLHREGTVVRADGVFRVRRGRGLARWLAWLSRLPAAGDTVPMQLTVTPGLAGEQWHRLFADRPIVSVISAGGDGVVIERMGVQEIHMRLEAIEGVLHYRSVGVKLRLGPLRIPLPRFLKPRVTASETGGKDERINVTVEVRLPLLGLLIAYDGGITLEAAP